MSPLQFAVVFLAHSQFNQYSEDCIILCLISSNEPRLKSTGSMETVLILHSGAATLLKT